MQKFIKHWRTTLGGIGSIAAGIAMVSSALLGEGDAGTSLEAGVGLISVGFAAIFSSDSSATDAEIPDGK